MTTEGALPQRPLLPGMYHVVRLSNDRVEVCNAGRVLVLTGEGFAERAVPLLAALDGRNTLDELREQFPGLTNHVVPALVAKGMVVDAAPPASDGSLPGLAALAVPGSLPPSEAARVLDQATVVLAGCGPVAGTVSVLLARAGVGRFLLADGGAMAANEMVVSPVLAPAHTGDSRVDAVAGLCREAGAGRTDTCEAPVPAGFLADASLVVIESGCAGAESPAPDADNCLAAGVPYLLHGQDGLEAAVGPLVGPGGAPCHRCLDARRLGHVPHPDEHLAYLRHRARAAPGPDAFLAAHVSTVAGIVATEALRFLIGAQPRCAGAVLVVDLVGTSVQREALLAVPGCPTCARTAPP